MYLASFIMTLLLVSLTLHINRLPFTALMLFIVVILSAIPVLNLLLSLFCIGELGLLAYRLNQAAKNRG